MIKVLERECQPTGNRPQYNKTIYEKPIANSILKGEKLEVIPLRSRKTGCPHPLYFFSTVFEVLAGAIRKEKEIKRMQIGKAVKLSPFAGGMI